LEGFLLSLRRKKEAGNTRRTITASEWGDHDKAGGGLRNGNLNLGKTGDMNGTWIIKGVGKKKREGRKHKLTSGTFRRVRSFKTPTLRAPRANLMRRGAGSGGKNTREGSIK